MLAFNYISAVVVYLIDTYRIEWGGYFVTIRSAKVWLHQFCFLPFTSVGDEVYEGVFQIDSLRKHCGLHRSVFCSNHNPLVLSNLLLR